MSEKTILSFFPMKKISKSFEGGRKNRAHVPGDRKAFEYR